MISYMIINHLSYASILDAPVTIQELCTRLLNTSTYICCNPDRIQLICPVQLLFWTFTGGAHHGGAERSRRNLQPVHADDVPECLSRTDQLVCPAVISFSFAQLVDLSNDRIHSWLRRRCACQSLSSLVQADALRMGKIPSTRQA